MNLLITYIICLYEIPFLSIDEGSTFNFDSSAKTVISSISSIICDCDILSKIINKLKYYNKYI